jgi:hypothetical protein
MEALEQSYKFKLAIDKLEGIPGLEKMATLIESRARRKVQRKNEVIQKALDIEVEEG